MPVAQIRHVIDGDDRYNAIVIWCPGCERTDDDGHKRGGLHMLPVTGDGSKRPTWEWNGDLERVTLAPSILTRHGGADSDLVCHSFLRDGHWQFLGDSTHPLAGQTVPMVPLPEWVTMGHAVKRLLILPAVAGTCAALYLSGLAWPIVVTAYSLFGRRPTTPYSEPELVA